jgi:PHD-finger
MFLEEVDDIDDTDPCQVCQEDDNEDVLMYCDHCFRYYHSYCVGLQEVPAVGHWFCDDCRAQRDVNPRYPCPPGGARNRSRPSHRRTRGQQRRFRSQDQATDASWTRVWQSVWDRINLDLDFPDDEEAAATAIRRHRQRNDTNRSEHEAWQLRRRIAELQGGGDSRFRDTETSLLDHESASLHTGRSRALRTRHHPGTPEEETTEDQQAWEAFEQARQEELNPEQTSRPNRRKRKSASNSPAEAQTDGSERASKRSRTMRRQDVGEASDLAASPQPRRLVPTRPSPPRPSPTRPSPTRPSPTRLSPSARPAVVETNGSGPSFLQSLLKEVEDSAAPNHPRGGFYRQSPLNAPSPITTSEHQSPRPSSPALSPSPSNHSSPRAMSATPPPSYSRPNSPTGLSSSIQPIFSCSDYSPTRSSPEPPGFATHGRSHRIPLGVDLASQSTHRHSSPPPSRTRSSESSPTRQGLSFNAKSDVQKMVSSALKPYYQKKSITKEEYTTINRDISRKLYDQIGDFEALGIEGRAKWEKVASNEVGRAVANLHDLPNVDPISSAEMVKVAS